MSLCYEILIVVLSFLFLSAVTSAFQLYTCKRCLQFSGLRMRNFTWNRFPIKYLLIDSLLTPIVESTYLVTQHNYTYRQDMQCKPLPWCSHDKLRQGRNQLFISEGTIFMKFHLMTSLSLYNRGITFPQTVADEVLFAAFPNMRTFQFQSWCRPNDEDRVKIGNLIQTLVPYWTRAVIGLVRQIYRLPVNLPNFSSCFNKYIKSII